MTLEVGLGGRSPSESSPTGVLRVASLLTEDLSGRRPRG